MRSRPAAVQDSRIFRFDSDDLDVRLMAFQALGRTGDGAARADGRNEDVYLSVRIAPDFFSRRLPMDGRIGRIVELLGE